MSDESSSAARGDRSSDTAARGASAQGPVRDGPALGLFGTAIGAWGSVCGVGGGVFAVPLLHYVYRMPLRNAVASSLALVAATTTAATVAEALRDDSALHVPTVAALVVTSVIGARAGFALARRIETAALKRVFALAFVAVAAKLALAPPHAAQAAGSIALSTGDYLTIAGAGLLAGIVSPLLGVGGGLVAVPALYLAVEPLGYQEARAASLAMSALNALYAASLYARAGEIRWRFARWLSAGALAGAVIGVWAVHLPGLVGPARALLAATLVLVAARFAADAWPGRSERAGPSGST